MRPPQPSRGERVVYCAKADCAHTGEAVPRELVSTDGSDSVTVAMYRCLADIVILDRRERFGKVCGAYAKRTT